MNQMISDDFDTFRRRHTRPLVPELPTHCMSGTYQDLRPNSWPLSGLPCRYSTPLDKGDPTVIDVGDAPINTEDPTIPGGISRVTRERHSEYAKHHEGGRRFLISLIHETRDDMVSHLKERGATDLERYVGDMTARLEAWATTIDEKYLVVKPRSDKEIEYNLTQIQKYPNLEPIFGLSRKKKTDRISETRFLLSTLQRSSYHRPGARLRDVVPDRAIEGQCRWRLDSDLSHSIDIQATYRKQAGFNFLNPLTRTRETKCVSLSSWGYQCGLSHLPLDLTLDQAELLVELYYTDLKNEADQLCDTHALMYFRVLMAEAVLQEYSLYGEAESWSREDTEEKAKRWCDQDIDETRSRIENVPALLGCIDTLLGDPGRSEEVWHQRSGKLVPNVAGLYRAVKETNMDLLAAAPGLANAGTPITEQSFRRYFKEHFTSADIDELRSESHP